MSSWSDFLLGRGALKKAASTGDAPKPAASAPEPVPNYVEQEIARQKQQPDAAPAPSSGGGYTAQITKTTGFQPKKKQPRIGFPPKKAVDEGDE